MSANIFTDANVSSTTSYRAQARRMLNLFHLLAATSLIRLVK